MDTCPRSAATLSIQAAFTLIELLIVIAIVAVLAGMLMPAIGSVRNAASSAVCASQFRQLGAGVFLYTTDWRGYLPPSRFQGCAPADLGYPAGITAAWSDAPWVGSYVDGTEIVGGSFGTKKLGGPWRCPADRKRIWPAGLAEVSYGLNCSLSPYANTTIPANFWTLLVPLRRLRASGALLLGAETMEARWYWPKTTYAGWPDIGFYDQATVTPSWTLIGDPAPNMVWWRHQRRANFLFADGHVELRGDPTPDVAAGRIFVRPGDAP